MPAGEMLTYAFIIYAPFSRGFLFSAFTGACVVWVGGEDERICVCVCFASWRVFIWRPSCWVIRRSYFRVSFCTHGEQKKRREHVQRWIAFENQSILRQYIFSQKDKKKFIKIFCDNLWESKTSWAFDGEETVAIIDHCLCAGSNQFGCQ